MEGTSTVHANAPYNSWDGHEPGVKYLLKPGDVRTTIGDNKSQTDCRCLYLNDILELREYYGNRATLILMQQVVVAGHPLSVHYA